MTIEDAQRAVDAWITGTGKGYFDPVTNVAVLAEEVGELAHVVLRLYGQQTAKPTDTVSREALADELADVLWVTLALANQTGVDLTEALQANIAKKNSRDAHRFQDIADV